MESKTLRSHRVIGEVADGTPQTCAFYDLGGVGYCAARVGGDAFHVMALDGLTVQSASPRLGREIRAIGAQGEWTYCAIDDEVWCFLRARFVGLAAGAPAAVDRFELCGNQPGTRQFFPNSFLGDDASWLGRSARNRYRHAVEQASRRWRGGRRDDAARTRRKMLISTQASRR